MAQPSKKLEVPELRFARSCYDHLAGVLAIAVRNELLRNGVLRHQSGGFGVTGEGKKILRTLEIDVDSLHALRRSFAHKCLDWTERHPHIGGALGAAMLRGFIERKWLARIRETRALRVTHIGEREFERTLNIRCAALRPVEKNSNIQTKINSI